MKKTLGNQNKTPKGKWRRMTEEAFQLRLDEVYAKGRVDAKLEWDNMHRDTQAVSYAEARPTAHLEALRQLTHFMSACGQTMQTIRDAMISEKGQR